MDSKGCMLCHRESDCKNIKSVLLLLESYEEKGVPDGAKAALENFKKTLETLGYEYPHGDLTCDLTDDKELSRKLVEEGLFILNMMQKKSS